MSALVIDTREALDALPIGAVMIDRDGWIITKQSDTEYQGMHPADNDLTQQYDAGELAGDYHDGHSEFFPMTLT